MDVKERDLISLLIIFTEGFMETLAHFLKFFYGDQAVSA